MMKKLDKFEIIEKVGQGAMGVVYKGRDPGIGRIVALKTLTSGLSEDPNLLRRFYTEAQSAGGLQHPNIVTIYELGQEGNTPFIAMQFINGESLDKIIDRRPRLPLSQKIGYIVYVCRALEYAHKQNPPVVHRDIKPGNVMVTTEGNVVVVDFGIARLGEGTRSQSAGLLIGTLGYMSPQLFRNKAADSRSDIWATGVMFYELLAYRRPFEGDNAAALMSNIILEKPRSLSEAAPGTPADVQAVVDRMLAKEVEARYQTMEEVLFDLEPLWRRLQQTDVYQLLEDSKQLFESGELESAKAGASQILKIDPTNASAKTLLEKINNEIRLRDLVPRLEASVASAKRLLQSGKVEEAKREVDAALQLDSRFLPARELRAQVEAEEERKRTITQRLGASKQSMAEGALTEAQLHLDKVLELDPGNPAALEQLRRIKEERSRRERRKQRDETLHRARTLWTNLQYEECIKLLVEGLNQFPNDADLSKLLESARQDQAEQLRQSLLAEARNLLNSQRCDDAVRALDRLLEQFPTDLTAKNLRAHALQARDQQIREQRLSEAKAKLRSWVKQVRYEDVIKHATPLSREFPDDFELTELIDFARTELSHLEQNRRLEQFSKQIQQALKEARFSEAIALSEKALREFPKNADFLMLLDRGKKEQAEREKSRKLEQSIREVERLIGREDLTGAIELTRQTISAFGRDSRLLNTLHDLEKEFEFREKKQDETLQQAQTLVGHGKLTDATSILNVALDTKLFSRDDPRITQLLNEIDTRKEPPSAAAAAAGATVSSSTFPGSPISSKPSSDPGKDYVYQRGTPPPDNLLSRGPEAVVSASSPTLITGSPQLAPPPPVVQPPAAKKTKEKKRRPGDPSHSGARGIEKTVSPLERTSTDLPSSTAEVGHLYATHADIFEPQAEPAPHPQPIPQPFWKSPLVLSGIAAALLIGVGATAYFLSRGSGQGITPRPAQPQQPLTKVTPGVSRPSEVVPQPPDAASNNTVKRTQGEVTSNPGSASGSNSVGPTHPPVKSPEPPTTSTTPAVVQNATPSRTPEVKPTVSTVEPTAPDISTTFQPTATSINTPAPSSAPPPKPTIEKPPVDTTAADKAEIQQLFTALSKAFESRNVVDLNTLLAHVDKGTLVPYQKAFENKKQIESVTRKYTVANADITITGETAKASGVWIGAGSRKDKPVLDARENWKCTLGKVDGHWVLTSLK